MPVDIDTAGTAGAYRLPAGSYARLLRKQCESRAQANHVDPYSALADDWRAALVESERAEKLAAIEAERMFAELLAAGEPIVVHNFAVATPGAPDWLRFGGASQTRIYRDDVCEPAAFRGERSPNGVGFEQVRVEPRHHAR